MFIVIKSEHYDCTNLICKKDTLEEAVAAVKDSMAQRINKNYHTGLTGADITHENEEHYRFSFDFDENRPADNSEPRVHGSYDFWKEDDEESAEWAVFEVTTDKPFFLLSYPKIDSSYLFYLMPFIPRLKSWVFPAGFYKLFGRRYRNGKSCL